MRHWRASFSTCYALFSPQVSIDGRQVVAGAADGAVYVWDLEAAACGKEAAPVVLRHHAKACIAAGFSLDGGVLLSADLGGSVAFWRAE